MHIIDYGPAVIFGFFYFIRGDLNFSKLRSLASPEAVEHVVEDEELVPVEVDRAADKLTNAIPD